MGQASDHSFAFQFDHDFLVGTEIHVHRPLLAIVSRVVSRPHADKLLEVVAGEIGDEAAGGIGEL